MLFRKNWRLTWATFAVAALAALPTSSRADEALAQLLDAAAGRFFISQSAEGTEIAERVLSRRLRTQSDFEDLLNQARADQLSGEDARLLRRQIRKLDQYMDEGSEGLPNDEIFDQLRDASDDEEIELTSRADRGRMGFLPDRVGGTFEANSEAFLAGGVAADGAAPGLAGGRRSALAMFDFDLDARIPSADRARAARIARKYGVDGFAGTNYAELVAEVYGELRLPARATREVALRAADRMAAFGKELEPLIAGLPVEAQRGVRYTIADGVLSLESFKAADFRPAAQHPLVDKQVGYVHTSDYPRYVRGFVRNTAPFTTHPFSQGEGILSIRDMRDIASHNMWPLELQPHDFRHVHYALSHPRAAAVYFKSARSLDPLRFTMVSAMYEGVDTIQYTHESGLARYMDQQMHMNLEDAMVYLAKASRADLLKLARDANILSDVEDYARQLDDWRPTYKGDYSPDGRSGRGLDADLDDTIAQFRKFARNPRNQPYLQYNRNATPGGPVLPADDSIQHY